MDQESIPSDKLWGGGKTEQDWDDWTMEELGLECSTNLGLWLQMPSWLPHSMRAVPFRTNCLVGGTHQGELLLPDWGPIQQRCKDGVGSYLFEGRLKCLP